MLVTHHVEEIPIGITHALLLKAGEVVAAGPLRDTLTAENLTATFDLGLSLTEDERAICGAGALSRLAPWNQIVSRTVGRPPPWR